MSKEKTLVKNATIVSLETMIHSNRPAGKLPVISLKVVLREKSMIRTLSGALFFENEEEREEHMDRLTSLQQALVLETPIDIKQHSCCGKECDCGCSIVAKNGDKVDIPMYWELL